MKGESKRRTQIAGPPPSAAPPTLLSRVRDGFEKQADPSSPRYIHGSPSPIPIETQRTRHSQRPLQ